MIYVRNLSSNQIILLYLKELFNHNLDICFYILKLKIKIENIENKFYYQIRYNKIAKEHYYLHKYHTNKFSYIFNDKSYIIKNDFKLDYFNYTGISYQIIELIHELIKNRKELVSDIYNELTGKSWLDYEDELYSILSDKITMSMKQI
jgi:hypothetical protein|tara:strand:+ start:81 stop:524 length:444 start_codon:yes stop_codon:yes gene_type:complete